MNAELENICSKLGVWRSNQIFVEPAPGISTGFQQLDAELPGRGWPSSSLCELLIDSYGIGELSLLLPSISKISKNQGIIFIAPPFIPYAPAFVKAGVDLNRLMVIKKSNYKDALSSSELALRSGACGIVVIWETNLFDRAGQIPHIALKKLVLAAQNGGSLAIVFRSHFAENLSSPAVLRIKLSTENEQVKLDLIKIKGKANKNPILINPRDALFEEKILYPYANLACSTFHDQVSIY